MNISAQFIHRPIATSLLGFAMLICGIIGYLKLPVSALPPVDFPTIQITTRLPGANPDTIVNIVTAPLERQLGQIPSLSNMSSQSSFGLSQITLQFELDRDIDAAAQDVQSAINAAGSTLPRNLPYPPTYAKVNPADTPILTIALSSKTVALRGLSDLADTLLTPKLSQISGVGNVAIQGGIKPAVRVQADLGRLASYGLSLEDLRQAIVAANVAGSKGSLDGAQQSYTIAANDQIDAAKAYSNITVAYRNGAGIRLRDVADVIDGLENTRVGGWYRGEPAIIIDVQRQPSANIIKTVDLLLKELPLLQRGMPAGVELKVVHDRTDTIRASIYDVKLTLVLSSVLVVLVVLLFLRTIRATLIAGVTLPLSIVATFGVMALAGFSLDNLSLMALTIGTGFVVDDAIVMIENIVRKMEEGRTPFNAALEGAKEIGFTVVSLTVSLIAVFIPLLFMTGLVGRMFREFALTLTIAVIVSAVISLTLTPMMCAMLLRSKTQVKEPIFLRLAEAPITWMADFYQRTLGWALKRQGLMLFLTFGTMALTAFLYVTGPKGFLPLQDTGLLTAVLEAAPEVSFAEMTRLQGEVTEKLQQDADVETVVSVIGVGALNPTTNVGRLTITLKSREQRVKTAAYIAERLRVLANSVAGVTLYIQPVQDIQISTRPSRSQYQYVVMGVDEKQVSEWSLKLITALRRNLTLRNVASETQDGGFRIFLNVDRLKAGRLGISMQSIDDTLNSAFGQRQISTIYAQSNQYRVVLEAAAQFQSSSTALSKLYVSGTGGMQIPLDSFVTFERITAPLAVAHDAQFPASIISFDLEGGASLGAAIEAVSKAEDSIELPSTVTGTFSADAAEFSKSLESEPWLILTAVITIYVVLGVLYESFIHPITILSTLPSAGVGALLALRLGGHDLSIIALIGIVLLMGIVKKNAIMMIDFALEAERVEGLSSYDAIVKACHLRFRPIMMTTLAALFGALPLALATGAGSELRVPLGVTIIGGLVLSQLLTLYTTPVIYLALERVRVRFSPLASPQSSPILWERK